MSVYEKQRSSSFGDNTQQMYAMAQHHHQTMGASPRKFNITDGLRSFHKASAFLPGFVVDNCNGKSVDISFNLLQLVHEY